MDRKAVDEGIQGAVQIYERRLLTVKRGEQLIQMMEDPEIEDGSLVKLSNLESDSLLDRAMDINGKKRFFRVFKKLD